MKKVIQLMVLLPILILMGCLDSNEEANEDEITVEVTKNGEVTEKYSDAVKEAINTYKEYAQAMEKKDIDAYLETFMERDREFIRGVTEHSMETLNKVYKVNSIEIIKENDRNIVLDVDQKVVYENRELAEVSEYEKVVTFTFVNEDGEWKIRAI